MADIKVFAVLRLFLCKRDLVFSCAAFEVQDNGFILQASLESFQKLV